jgi:ABC-type branched-subunit amino acid transport system permease subunit
MAFEDYDLSSTMRPTGSPGEDIPRRPLSGVEIGVITVAAAVAVVTLCVMLSLARSRVG